jgi:hypothetical protein
VSHANLLYIEDLKMKTPNSGTTLHQLGMSHSQNLPMINSGLIGWQRRLDALESWKGTGLEQVPVHSDSQILIPEEEFATNPL